MTSKIAASLIAITAMAAAAPALAQAPAAAAPAKAEAPAAGGLSVEKTPIGDIIKNDKAKAALEAAIPTISQYYDQIASMTLKQVQPMSQGALTDEMLAKVQAAFDQINTGK
jgi:hypothetical protein